MSLRDWLAGMALQGLLANSEGPIQANKLCGWSLINCTEKDVAELALSLADAVIAVKKGGADE
jgi:hypothetical protein